MGRRAFIVLFILFCISLMIGSGFYMYLNSFQPVGAGQDGIEEHTDPVSSNKNEKINVLVLGVDAGIIGLDESRNRRRTDTIFVVSFDPNTKDVKLLSIPRDTRAYIDGYGFDKINAANVYGGVELVIKVVKELLEIPIHYYVKVDYKGFRQIVDDLGGVEIYVERPMHYDDYAQNLHIHLEKGLQLLDGEKAEQFVRFRKYPNGDIGRIQAQQKFLKALAKKVLNPMTIFKIPRIAKTLTMYVETNMDPGEIVKYANILRQIRPEDIEMAVLPGIDRYINGISYYLVDINKTQELVDKYFRNIDPSNLGLNIEVLNGSGISGAASRAANRLKSYGFNVRKVGNADSFNYKTTRIIYSEGKLEKAKEIASIIKGTELIEQNPDNSDVDIIVIIGRDYN